MQQRNELDKKFLKVAQELSEALVAYQWDEAYTKAGELNSLLKQRDQMTLPGYMLDSAQNHLRSFYHQNTVVQKAHKAMIAVGHKLVEFK